jgi:hypothetical protein
VQGAEAVGLRMGLARRWAYAVCWCSHRVWVSFYTIGCRPRSQRRVPCRPARAPGGCGGPVCGVKPRAARPDAPPPGAGAPLRPGSRGDYAQSRGIENQADDPQRSKSQSETVRDKLDIDCTSRARLSRTGSRLDTREYTARIPVHIRGRAIRAMGDLKYKLT